MIAGPSSETYLSIFLISKWAQEYKNLKIDFLPDQIARFASAIREEKKIEAQKHKENHVDFVDLVNAIAQLDEITEEKCHLMFWQEHLFRNLKKNPELDRIYELTDEEILNEYIAGLNINLSNIDMIHYENLYNCVSQLISWGFWGDKINTKIHSVCEAMYKILLDFEVCINIDRKYHLPNSALSGIDMNIRNLDKFLKRYDYDFIEDKDYLIIVGKLLCLSGKYKRWQNIWNEFISTKNKKGRLQIPFTHFFLIDWVYKKLGEMAEKEKIEFNIYSADSRSERDKLLFTRDVWTAHLQNVLSAIKNIEYKIRGKNFNYNLIKYQTIEQTASNFNQKFDYWEHLNELYPFSKHIEIIPKKK